MRRTITRQLEFDYGHRLVGHESKCSHLHGHRGVVHITVLEEGLDSCGRVIDFSKIKEVVGGWIDEHWDHNFIFNQMDPFLHIDPLDLLAVVGKKQFYTMPDNKNPTAENMVEVLAVVSAALLNPYGITMHSVRLYETPNCWADYTFEE